MTQKLYKVKLIGLSGNWCGTNYQISYVIATDPTAAYTKIRAFLDKRDIGFHYDRELDTIELVAEACETPDCRTLLLP